MRWMVALIWRLPPRSSRWRLVLPELTGIEGLLPYSQGNRHRRRLIFTD
jgi:hypothetical protein